MTRRVSAAETENKPMSRKKQAEFYMELAHRWRRYGEAVRKEDLEGKKRHFIIAANFELKAGELLTQ